MTAPVVNKWENGNSLRDITLLAPIAILLNITIDTLLSFEEGLTREEINSTICELKNKLEKVTYEETFQFAKRKVEQYSNCEQLIWQELVDSN